MDKQEIREEIWKTMEERNIARFPRPVHGRIPNFVGAEEAAKKLTELTEWADARVIKSNPDSPQKPVRELALQDGKIVYMAVPRLKELECFVELDPRFLASNASRASTIKGAFKYGRKIHPKNMKKVDLVIAGSVAVNEKGGRVGKGGGYSDLEFAIASHFNLVSEDTPIVTTVHPVQVVDLDIEMKDHDVPLSTIVTKSKTIKTHSELRKPAGILWQELDKQVYENIPVLISIQNR
ncbi:MAG: 5-formyltetrahydrofolate cyclo-ligase [Methanobacteriota archaeon]|nr:MAG: 5-formyltetrahydrofolate cyclo-ligase [Euryarchaeota archaeon]